MVRVLDDDTTGDAIWNTILRTKINYRFSIDGLALSANGGLNASAGLDGGFTVLDTPERIVIDGPDQIATVVFQVPETANKKWVADGELRDSEDNLVGRVQFSQIWNTRSERAALEQELQQRVAAAEHKEASSFGWILFWVVIGVLSLVWFYTSLMDKAGKAKAATHSSDSSS